ncbi:MAG TPA: hypothetical protein VFE42_13810 [Chloroflexota bacterium]|nr:hypothetical protein [Chloroflexota bacterium]
MDLDVRCGGAADELAPEAPVVDAGGGVGVVPAHADAQDFDPDAAQEGNVLRGLGRRLRLGVIVVVDGET